MVTQRPEFDSLVPAGADKDVLRLNWEQLRNCVLVTGKGLQTKASKG